VDEPIALDPDEQLEQALDFLDDYLHDGADVRERSVRYYTAGEGKWRTVADWPPPGIETLDWYLAPNASLETAPPNATGSDRYLVDFDATTGKANRWATQKDGGDVVYPDRASAADALLTYTSQPLSEALHLVGHAAVELQLASNQPDAALIVYLEDVSPEGRVTYVTEGQLRLLHRKTADAPYVTFGVSHSFLREDASKPTTDQTELVELTLLPVAALIAKGHRIRLSIAGHDAGTFRRYPAAGTTEFTLEHSPDQVSRLSLPILPR
jgi:putative CocE/NonD family hydrolase